MFYSIIALIDELVDGMLKQKSDSPDGFFVDEVRNHLFEQGDNRGGLDLLSLNIQRGRDHGLKGKDPIMGF